MTSTDLIGQQFLESCQRAKVMVPEQVAVIGVDNDELMCDICTPQLTSVIVDDESVLVSVTARVRISEILWTFLLRR